jgi:hypothetical protein
MQPNHSHVSRPLPRKTLKRQITGVALLTAVVLALVTACGSSGNSTAGASSGEALSNALNPAPSSHIPATPPDVPSGNVSCPDALPNPVSVPSDLQSLIGLCDNQDGSQLEIINFSQYVLNIYPAPGSTLLGPVTYDVSSSPLPTLADELEVESQNAVVAGLTPPSGAVLLAVGATITAVAGNPPARVYVGVDRVATAEAFAAATWTSYVMGSDSDANPDDFYQDIADCVNSTYAFWKGLQDQPPQSDGQLLLESLDATIYCKVLQDKVKELFESRGEQEDIPHETQLAGENSDEADWAQKYEEDEGIEHELIDDIR